MITLLLCWFLFAFPLLLGGAFLLGAFVYFTGNQGKSPTPTLSLPKFSIGRAHGEKPPRATLPEV